MLTLFTTAKAFEGHSRVIQRNALKSWTLLHPDVEVILFGDEEGAAEVCRELGIRHEPHVERNEVGLKRINDYFDRAQKMARHEALCYVNCDIVLMAEFCEALDRVRKAHSRFLMVGRRWDTEIREPIDFLDPAWVGKTWGLAVAANQQRDARWIDYFAFNRGLYLGKIPPMVIGRVAWDNWLVWKARQEGADIIDASRAVMAIHQNHGYGYHPAGAVGVWGDEHASENLRLAGGRQHLYCIADATHAITRRGWIFPTPLRREWHQLFTYFREPPSFFTKQGFLNRTVSLRRRLGLRRQALRRARAIVSNWARGREDSQ